MDERLEPTYKDNNVTITASSIINIRCRFGYISLRGQKGCLEVLK